MNAEQKKGRGQPKKPPTTTVRIPLRFKAEIINFIDVLVRTEQIQQRYFNKGEE